MRIVSCDRQTISCGECFGRANCDVHQRNVRLTQLAEANHAFGKLRGYQTVLEAKSGIIISRELAKIESALTMLGAEISEEALNEQT